MVMQVASFKGYGGRSSIGALLLLTEGLVSLLLTTAEGWDPPPHFAH